MEKEKIDYHIHKAIDSIIDKYIEKYSDHLLDELQTTDVYDRFKFYKPLIISGYEFYFIKSFILKYAEIIKKYDFIKNDRNYSLVLYNYYFMCKKLINDSYECMVSEKIELNALVFKLN